MKKIFLIVVIIFSIIVGFYCGYKFATHKLDDKLFDVNNKNKDEFIHVIDKKLENCINSTHPYLYSNCVRENENDWNIEINKQIEQIKNVISKEDFDIISTAQNDWKKSVNSDEKMVHKLFSNRQGTINETQVFSYFSNIKKQRALMLNNIYNDFEEIE